MSDDHAQRPWALQVYVARKVGALGGRGDAAYRLLVLSRGVPWRRTLGWFGLLVAATLIVVAAIYVMFWPVSDVIARHDVGAVTGPPRAAALRTARDAAQGRLLALCTGLFAAGALIYIARHLTLSRRNIELAEQGQVTDRYTKAIEQLGSDKLDVRVGGIYALERVAGDSARDHPTVMEVLTAFIREHSHEQWPPSADEPDAGTAGRGTRPDVQAAITVIGRRNSRRDRQAVNLTHANLSAADLAFGNFTSADLTNTILTGTDLVGAKLTRALLAGADITGADLTSADLTFANLSNAFVNRADLTRADLTRADLTCADFTGADFSEADLTGAYLRKAVLTGAYLTQADLTGADLTGADLTGTVLSGAYLTRADLTQADLTNALWLPYAAAPEGWQRDTESGRLRRVSTNSAGAAEDESS
jgi:uncharacterized protein YjbI with pentapeptide repeats